MNLNFFGRNRILVPKEQKNYAMNVIMINCLYYKKVNVLQDHSLEIIISSSMLKKYQSIFEDNGIKAEFGDSKGFTTTLYKYKNRWGVILGVIILLFSVYLSSKFVWRINIVGNSKVSNEEILTYLEQSGFYKGSYIPKVNYGELHNKFLMNCDKVCWISVNIKGNVANVMVRERMIGDDVYINTPSNVVAKRDGQIHMITLYDGKKEVSVGDVVNKGDILISGVINSKSQGVRYVHADGIVKAYVSKQIIIKMPYITEEKLYTGNEKINKKIKIFSKNIDFLYNNKNSYEFCDTIIKKEYLTLFGKIELPVLTTTETQKEYEFKKKEYSKKQTVDMAFEELNKRIEQELYDSDMVSKTVETRYDDEFFYIECNLYCIENIASVVEFSVK